MKRTLKHLLASAALALFTSGCAELPGILGPAEDVLDILCDTREPLRRAHAALEEGDVGLAIDILHAYLVEYGHDDEVEALLLLLEAQVKKVVGF